MGFKGERLSSQKLTLDAEADFKGLNALNQAEAGNESSGKSLHQIYHKDVLEKTTPSEKEGILPSFWNKISSIWLEPQKKSTDSKIQKLDAKKIEQAEPISPIPLIDKPTLHPHSDLTLERAVPKLPILNKAQPNESLSSKELEEILVNMSSHTMEEIMTIVIKAQLEIEQSGANLSQDCFTRLINLRKLQEKTLDDIKKALERDEKIGNGIKTVQTIAMAAAAICGIATIAVSIAATAGIALPFIVTFIGSKVASGAVLAGSTSLLYFGKGYNDYRTNKDKAKMTEFKHEQKKSMDSIEDYREKIVSFAESDSYFKEQLIAVLKRLEKMKRMIFQK